MNSWDWFKAELVRLLGQDGADALFAELSRRRKQERLQKQRANAAKDLVYFSDQLRQAVAEGRSTKRIEQAIARRRKLMS